MRIASAQTNTGLQNKELQLTGVRTISSPLSWHMFICDYGTMTYMAERQGISVGCFRKCLNTNVLAHKPKNGSDFVFLFGFVCFCLF